MSRNSDGEILCLSCPPGDKPVAEFQWHPGSVGVYPACIECAKDDLVDADELPEWKRDKEPVAGYLTPINGGPKIRTWEEWNDYQENLRVSDESRRGTEQ